MTDEEQTKAREVTSLCSQTIVVLHDLLSKLTAIRDAYDTIAYPTGEASSGTNVLTQTTIPVDSQSFKPVTKTPDVKGNPLSELLHNLSEADKAKLTTALQQKVGNDNAKT